MFFVVNSYEVNLPSLGKSLSISVLKILIYLNYCPQFNNETFFFLISSLILIVFTHKKTQKSLTESTSGGSNF